ncbi:MAG: N-acetylmuramic acid 6-phosphate etherase [Rhodospirillales bacterium]|nr:N-acetylmuramic acid 6-phosphate etherase [Rhodospirillales bacterium]
MTTFSALPATESTDPRFADLDAWPPAVALAAMWEGQMAAVAAVGAALPAIEKAVAAAVPLLAAGGRLAYAGAGTSGRLGVQDGVELTPTFDWPHDRVVLLLAGGEAALTGSVENAEDDGAAAVADLDRHRLGAGDVLLGIAASAATPYTLAAIKAARERGALTIAIVNSDGPMVRAAEHVLLAETAPEVLAGSTRMKAGTAQKIMLNLFSTLAMLRLGRVHRGLMVDMLARNAKLRGRARRMLHQLTGADEAAIDTALAATGGRVKPAVLVLSGLSADDAEALLLRHDGQLRAALASLA